MTAPIRSSNLARAAPLDGRGRRLPLTLLHLTVRNCFLRAAAEIHCSGMSGRQAAAVLHTRLSRYRSGAWRRDASEPLVLPRLVGRLDGWLWCVLKVHDRLVSERLIRAVLSQT